MCSAPIIRSLTVTLVIALGLAGCGLKGPLYLPDKATNVEVHPAAPPPPPAEPSAERDREKSRNGTTPAPGE